MKDDTHILVVDNQESMRDLLSSLLTDVGYQVTSVASAEEAIELFKSNHYPVALTDISLEGMDGIELLEKLKEHNEDTQVILSANNASLDTVLTAIRAGAYDYILKPFDELDHITAVVNRALEKVHLVKENRNLLDKLMISNQMLSEQNEKLQELAIQDGLTGLHNHRFFQETLARNVDLAGRSGLPCSLVFMDIDHFKHFNDTQGHPAGDEVLKHAAKIISTDLRKSDLAARYGGEEFVLLLPGTDKSGALTLAEKVRHRIESHPFQGGESQPLGKVTVSIGVAAYPDDATKTEELLTAADQALYKAKQEGRNRVCGAQQD